MFSETKSKEKMMLIVYKPEDCGECFQTGYGEHLCDIADVWDIKKCPGKPLPRKMTIYPYESFREYFFKQGYNSCVDEILGVANVKDKEEIADEQIEKIENAIELLVKVAEALRRIRFIEKRTKANGEKEYQLDNYTSKQEIYRAIVDIQENVIGKIYGIKPGYSFYMRRKDEI